MKNISEEQLEHKLKDAISKRDFWIQKCEDYEITLRVFRELEPENQKSLFQGEEDWVMSYLQGNRDERAYGRLSLFKAYIEKSGGKAHRDEFRKELSKHGDNVSEGAWRTFLENNASKKGLKYEEKGIYSIA